EVATTLDKMKIDASKLAPAHPLTLTLEDFARTTPPSESLRYWLRDTTVSVIPATFTVGRPMKTGRFSSVTFSYYATLQLQHGWICKVATSENAYPLISCSSPSGAWGLSWVKFPQ